jgi:hypothetical protein
LKYIRVKIDTPPQTVTDTLAMPVSMTNCNKYFDSDPLQTVTDIIIESSQTVRDALAKPVSMTNRDTYLDSRVQKLIFVQCFRDWIGEIPRQLLISERRMHP